MTPPRPTRRLVGLCGLAVGGLAALAGAVHAQGAAPLPLPPIPVAAYPGTPTGSEPRLITFASPHDVACAEGRAIALEAADLAPLMTAVQVEPRVGYDGATAPPPPVVAPSFSYTFAISADGRVLDLKRSSSPMGAVVPPHQPYVGDYGLVPELARWRFAPGQPYSGCSVALQGRIASYEQAGRAWVVRAFALSGAQTSGSPLTRAVQEGGDCIKQPLHPRVIYYPPTDQLARDPNHRDWVVTRYDIAADGAVRNVQVLGSSGRRELEQMVTAAEQRSRFAPTPRQGCLGRNVLAPAPLPAPPEPPVETSRSNACPVDPKLTFNLPMSFPPAYTAARVEGYALISFDVAPWGQVGQVKVVKSEPVADFGEVAANAVRTAHAAPSERGYQGCLKPVRFRIAEEGESSVEPGR